MLVLGTVLIDKKDDRCAYQATNQKLCSPRSESLICRTTVNFPLMSHSCSFHRLAFGNAIQWEDLKCLPDNGIRVRYPLTGYCLAGVPRTCSAHQARSLAAVDCLWSYSELNGGVKAG